MWVGISQVMTLYEALEAYKTAPIQALDVDLPGWERLYIRLGPRLIEDTMVPFVLTFANIEAEDPGNGAMESLFQDLSAKGIPLYVENAHNPRLPRRLVEDLGFIRVNAHMGPNFYKEPEA